MKAPRKSPNKTLAKRPYRRGRLRKHRLSIDEVKGKTVDFVEMGTSAEFPYVEIGFDDRTALSFILGGRLTMEPVYSDWTTGNQRLLRRWPVQETT